MNSFNIQGIIYSCMYAAPCSEGSLQLVGDTRYQNFGRMEICINGSWGKICSDMWTNHDARVLCKHFGYSPYGR